MDLPAFAGFADLPVCYRKLIIYMKKEKLEVGDTCTHNVSFTQDEVKKFAALTKDTNPIHLDEAYASGTVFKRPIVHGYLSGAVFSKVFGTLFPGIGTIYLYQEMKFRRPVYTGEKYIATFEVTEIVEEKNRANIYCQLLNSENKVCIEGQATVMHLEKIG